MPQTIKVSVLTVNHNMADTVGSSINCVNLQKTNFRYEHIIVDDGSTDDSVDAIEHHIADENLSYLVKIPHSGMMTAMMVGLSLCDGEYIAICDADDYWIDDNKLQHQADLLDKHGSDLHFTSFNTSKGVVRPAWPTVKSILTGRFAMPSCTIMFRRSTFEKLKPFTRNDYTWDVPLMLEFVKNARVNYDYCVTAFYTISEESFSHTRSRKKRLRYVIGLAKIKLKFIRKYGCDFPTAVFLVKKFARDVYSVIFKRWYKS